MDTDWLPFELTIQERFERYHAANPATYETLVRFCREAQRSGRKRFAIGTLWERMRWYMNFEKDDAEDFKLNDHYRSRYARMLMEKNPEFEGLFEIRELRRQ